MGSNTYTKGYSDGSSLTEAQLDNAYQTLQADISNTALMTTGSTSGQVFTSNGSGVAGSFQGVPDPLGPFALRNYGLKATVASGVMKITLLTKAGATPSGTDIVDFVYSNNGTATGTYNSIQVEQATTFTLSASATLGFTSTSTSRIFVYGYYNTATTAVKLAVSARSDLDRGETKLTVAMSASADSLQNIYSSAVLTVIPRLLGHVDAAVSSAGLWQSPNRVNVSNNIDLENIPTVNQVVYGNTTRATGTTVARGGVAISADSGGFSTQSTTAVNITNLSVTITTAGRPVCLVMVSSNGGNDTDPLNRTCLSLQEVVSGNAFIHFKRASSDVGVYFLRATSGTDNLYSPTSPMIIDPVGSGTYTYTVQGYTTTNSNTLVVNYYKLVAYEL